MGSALPKTHHLAGRKNCACAVNEQGSGMLRGLMLTTKQMVLYMLAAQESDV